MSQQLAREADREPGELARAREAAAQAEAARAEAARSRAQAETARLVAARSWFAARSEANALRAELAKVRADSEAAVQEARELLRRESREGADRLASAQAETDQLAGEVGALRSALEAAEAARRSAEERREGEANELSLLRARGSELCSAILGAPTVARPLSDVMQSAASSHRELVRQHDDLRGAVISATTTLTGRSFTGLSLAESLVDAARELRENHSRVQSAGYRLCDLALGPPTSRVQLTARLDEACRQIEADGVELEDFRAAAARIRDVVLGASQGPSSLPAALESVADAVENRLDAAATNGVRWGTRSSLVVTLSHFPELEAELELLGSGRDAETSEAELDRLWEVTGPAAERLAGNVSASTARCPPDDDLDEKSGE